MQLSYVIIADDDFRVIEDLMSTISWEELGYVVKGTATNGLDALKLIRRYHPDLLITDIIMPSMTGLELITEARREFHDMQILIISSYDDFEYAKTAITHGVDDYILKTQIDPISFSQRLTLLSQQAVARKNRDRAALRQSLQDYFNYRIVETISESYNPVLYSALRLSYYFIIVGVHLPFTKDKSVYDRITSLNISLAEDIIVTQFNDSGIPLRFIYGPFLVLGFVAARKEQDVRSGMQSLILRIRSILNTSMPQAVTLFCERQQSTIPEFRTQFFELMPKMLFETAFSCNIVRDLHELREISYCPDSRSYTFGSFPWNPHELQDNLERLTRYLHNRIDEHDHASLLNVYWSMGTWICTGSKQDDYEIKTNYFSSPETIVSHMNSFITQQINLFSESSTPTYPWAITGAIEYIIENYGNHELSVQNIADAVNVSPGYLGVLFRKHLGKSPNEYLTDVRIERAVYLLENTTMKMYEVADICGFNTSHYFSDIMYRKTGRRPIDYKNRNIQE